MRKYRYKDFVNPNYRISITRPLIAPLHVLRKRLSLDDVQKWLDLTLGREQRFMWRAKFPGIPKTVKVSTRYKRLFYSNRMKTYDRKIRAEFFRTPLVPREVSKRYEFNTYQSGRRKEGYRHGKFDGFRKCKNYRSQHMTITRELPQIRKVEIRYTKISD